MVKSFRRFSLRFGLPITWIPFNLNGNKYVLELSLLPFPRFAVRSLLPLTPASGKGRREELKKLQSIWVMVSEGTGRKKWQVIA
jgi:hypothetical protein